MMASRDNRPTLVEPGSGDQQNQSSTRPQVVPLRGRAPDPLPDLPLDEEGVERTLIKAIPEDPSRSKASPIPPPRLRKDLLVKETEGGTVRVRAPESQTEFSIYKVEWKVAKAMDGTRSLADIARIAGREGLAADEKLVRSLVQELKGYRFLDTTQTAPAPQRSSIEDVVLATISDEERSLAESAAAVLADSGEDQIAGYLSAILQINPDNEAAKAMQAELASRVGESRPRRTTNEITPVATVVHDRSRRLLYIVAGVAMTAIVIAAVLVYQANRALNVALSRVATTPAPAPVEAPRPSAPAPSEPAPTRPTAVHVKVEVQPVVVETVHATMKGVVAEVSVKTGETVKRNAVVALVTDESSYNRYAAARAQLADVEARAHKDPVLRYFLAGSRAKLRKAIAKIKLHKIVAQREGTIGEIHVDVGNAVTAEAPLVELTDTSELNGSIPVALIPFSVEGASCALERAANVCKINAGSTERMQVVIDNARRNLESGETIDILVSPPQPPQ